MDRLEGEVASITGAARGHGRSHAVCLAQEGADVRDFDALKAAVDGRGAELGGSNIVLATAGISPTSTPRGPRGPMNRWLLLAGAIVTETSATLALRAASETPAWFAVVAIGYTASFLLLAGVLRTGMAIGVAYSIWAAIGVSVTALAATVLFDEQLTPVMGLGLVTVIAGVLLVELGSHRAGQATAVYGGTR